MVSRTRSTSIGVRWDIVVVVGWWRLLLLVLVFVFVFVFIVVVVLDRGLVALGVRGYIADYREDYESITKATTSTTSKTSSGSDNVGNIWLACSSIPVPLPPALPPVSVKVPSWETEPKPPRFFYYR
jgi:hypothetical protein